MKSNRTILVTGGGGYVGSHTIIELLNNNYFVIVIDNLVSCYAEPNEKPESLKRIEKLTNQIITFYKVDVRDRYNLDKIFKTHIIDSVMHFAALKSVGESVNIPLEYYQNNVSGSCVLLEVMRNNGVKNLIFSSSATVYGIPQVLPISEKHQTGQSCTNPYGRTNYFVEEIIKDVCTSDSEWKVIFLRYFNPVGAHESGQIGEDPSGKPNNLMPFISQVAIGRREKLYVFGNDYNTKDGSGVRDYIHVTDLATGHLKALQKMSEPDFKGWKAYNLGTGQGYSVLDLINAFTKASGRNINYVIVNKREGDADICYVDPSLAKKELRWHATRGLDEMCNDTWRWQKLNPNGFIKKDEGSD